MFIFSDEKPKKKSVRVQSRSVDVLKEFLKDDNEKKEEVAERRHKDKIKLCSL